MRAYAAEDYDGKNSLNKDKADANSHRMELKWLFIFVHIHNEIVDIEQ